MKGKNYMNKKILKKLAIFFLIVFLTITGISSLVPNYDESILKDAKNFTESTDFSDLTVNPFLNTTTRFDVNETKKNGNTNFKVNINDTIINIHVKASTGKKIVPIQTFPPSNSERKIIESSKKKVLKYISRSKILRNKSGIKDFISNLPVREAIFENDEECTGAVFYDEKDFESIYINKKDINIVCEWMLVHEYIHAIVYYTHGYSVNDYAYSLFNEIFTDLITASLTPQIADGIKSAYADYFYLIYPYVNLFTGRAIDAYFYGYENIYDFIPKEEFDFFVTVIQNYNMDNFDIYYNNLIYKFYSYISAPYKEKDALASFSYFFYKTNCNTNPDTTPTKYIIPTILKFSFKCFLLVLNKTKSPTPAPVSKPEIKDAILSTFSI